MYLQISLNAYLCKDIVIEVSSSTVMTEPDLMIDDNEEEVKLSVCPVISIEEANLLVEEHKGWAESIIRSVARAWSLDWQLDGLDGAGMEALIFCARRFQPGRSVPFRGYARRRIHEAASEAARRCRGWKRASASLSPEKRRAREVAVGLLNVFPELRDGEVPVDAGGDMRGTVRQLLMGAALLGSTDTADMASPDELVDFKKMVSIIKTYEEIHQLLLWKVYWEGFSLRKVAAEWETDGLNVIREHKSLLGHLYKSLAVSKSVVPQHKPTTLPKLVRPKVRPGLRSVMTKLKKKGIINPFAQLQLI